MKDCVCWIMVMMSTSFLLLTLELYVNCIRVKYSDCKCVTNRMQFTVFYNDHLCVTRNIPIENLSLHSCALVAIISKKK